MQEKEIGKDDIADGQLTRDQDGNLAPGAQDGGDETREIRYETRNINETAEGEDITTAFIDVGAQLAAAREKAGISVSDVAAHLRMTEENILALEKGDIGVFPSAVYAIGHVRSHARLSGLDAEPLCARLQRARSDAQKKPEYNFITNRFAAPKFAGRMALAIFTVAVLGYSGWYVTASGLLTPPDETVLPLAESIIGEEAVADAESVTIIADAADEVADESTTAVVTTAQTSGDNADDSVNPITNTDTATPETIITAESTPVQRITPATAAGGGVQNPVATGAEQNAFDASPAVPRAGSAVASLRNPLSEITLKASATSWVEITRADGSALASWLMRAGDEYAVPEDEDFYLTTGNAGGLTITIGKGEGKILGAVGETISELPLDPVLLSNRY